MNFDMSFSVLVLSGGRASRLGQDKASTIIGGITMMERVLHQIPEYAQVIIVGELPANIKRKVILTREEPAGAGPLSALAAGLSHVETKFFLLLATDMPFVGNLGMKLLESLGAAPEEIDAVIPIDDDERLQPLCGAYRTERVRNAISRIGEVTNGSMKHLLAELRIQNQVHSGAWVLSDIDTVASLEKARIHARNIEGVGMMDEWISDVKSALGLNVDVDVDLLLAIARDAAHNVMRPAAPITTYLLGIAIAGGQDPKVAAAKIEQLALSRVQTKGE